MAKQVQKRASTATVIDDNKQYSVRVVKPFEWPPGSRNYFRPHHHMQMRGRVIKALPEGRVTDVTEV